MIAIAVSRAAKINHVPFYTSATITRPNLITCRACTLRPWGAEQANRYTDILTAAFAELAQSPGHESHPIGFILLV